VAKDWERIAHLDSAAAPPPLSLSLWFLHTPDAHSALPACREPASCPLSTLLLPGLVPSDAAAAPVAAPAAAGPADAPAAAAAAPSVAAALLSVEAALCAVLFAVNALALSVLWNQSDIMTALLSLIFTSWLKGAFCCPCVALSALACFASTSLASAAIGVSYIARLVSSIVRPDSPPDALPSAPSSSALATSASSSNAMSSRFLALLPRRKSRPESPESRSQPHTPSFSL
jgi:hypothetical protein